MGRVLGPIVFLALVAVTFVIRDIEHDQARRLIEGEALGRAMCRRIEAVARPIVAGGRALPGFGALVEHFPELVPMPGERGAAPTYATDAVYIYGLSTRVLRGEDGQARHDYILRAWPLDFGVTGDLEFLIQDGVFWEGRNRLGRSGTEIAFPPPFPATEVNDPRPPWWRVDRPAEEDSDT